MMGSTTMKFMSISILQRGLRLWSNLQKCFVGALTSLVRANNKINLAIITNSASVFVFLVGAQKLFSRKCANVKFSDKIF